ncbi:MAG: family 16 glycoside hydrolase, partial [Opitutaceae bacterium]
MIAVLLAFCTVIAPVKAASGDDQPISPRQPIVLFNGKDLSGFYTWEKVHGREDPHRVFTVVDQVDGAPAIRLSGQHVGGIVTRERYANYRLVAEYRWGLVTWEPRKNRTRAGSISLHCQGEDGNHAKDFRAPWMRAVEFFLGEGSVGDLILLGGYERGQAEPIVPHLTVALKAGAQIWDPEGTPSEVKKGRIHWRGRDPEWKDVLGFRGRNDVEKPTGEWNRVEAVCAGGDVT